MNWLNSFKKRPSTLINLAIAILVTAEKCESEIRKFNDKEIGIASDKTKDWTKIRFEFVFFITHLTMRVVFSKFGNEIQSSLGKKLAPLLFNLSCELWYSTSLPKNTKDSMHDEFFMNLQNSDDEYTKYKKLSPEGNERPKDTLFWEFGKNIVRLMGNEEGFSVAAMYQTMFITTDYVATVKIFELADSAVKEL